MHDIAMPSEYWDREQHHIYGAEIIKQLLTELNYPKERIEQVKNCVLNHRGSTNRPRNTIEEQCVADADVIMGTKNPGKIQGAREAFERYMD